MTDAFDPVGNLIGSLLDGSFAESIAENLAETILEDPTGMLTSLAADGALVTKVSKKGNVWYRVATEKEQIAFGIAVIESAIEQWDEMTAGFDAA